MNIMEKNMRQSSSLRFQAGLPAPRPAGPRFSRTVASGGGFSDQFVRSGQPDVQFAGTTRRNFLYSGLIGLGMLLAGCGGDDGIVGPGPIEPVCTVAGDTQAPHAGQVLQEDRASAVQVQQDGVPINQSRLEIPLADNLRGCSLMVDPAGMHLETVIENPATGLLENRAVPVADARSEGGRLVLIVDGPVSTGSQLTLDPGAVVLENGQEAQGMLHLDGSDLQDPRIAALWFKAFEPFVLDLFPPETYPGASAPIVQQQPQDEGTVQGLLNNHFQAYLDAGLLTSAQAGELLGRFYDPAYRQIFTHPQTGEFSAHLMAMVLATAGSPGEELIRAIMDGENETGRRGRVIFSDNLPSGAIAGAEVIIDEDGLERWVISVDPGMRNEPFEVGSAFLAHEGAHQDNIQGLKEEKAAKSIEINTWKSHLLVNPNLATLGTGGAKLLNLQVMMQENSGRHFPNGGLFEAPLLQQEPNVVPNSNFTLRSFAEALSTFFYPNVPDVETPGNTYLDEYVSLATGVERHGLNFDDSVLESLDNPKIFAPEENAQSLRILALNPAKPHQGTQFA